MVDEPRKQGTLPASSRLSHAVDRFDHLQHPFLAVSANAVTSVFLEARWKVAVNHLALKELSLEVGGLEVPSMHPGRVCLEDKEERSLRDPGRMVEQ